MKTIILLIVALLAIVGCGGSGGGSSASTTGKVTGSRNPGTYTGRIYRGGGNPVGTATTVVDPDGVTITVTTHDAVLNQDLVWHLSVDPSTNDITGATLSGLTYSPVVGAGANFANNSVSGNLDYTDQTGTERILAYDGSL